MGRLLGLLKGPFGDVIGGVRGIIDDLHTSEAEKLAAQIKLTEIQARFNEQLLEADVEWAKAQAEVIKSEATSENWLASSWRPILMLTFTFIIAWNFVVAPIFSVEVVGVPPDMWELLKIGVGGYIIGRSAEKIVPQVLHKPQQ